MSRRNQDNVNINQNKPVALQGESPQIPCCSDTGKCSHNPLYSSKLLAPGHPARHDDIVKEFAETRTHEQIVASNPYLQEIQNQSGDLWRNNQSRGARQQQSNTVTYDSATSLNRRAGK